MITKDEISKIGKFQKTHALKGELNMICEIGPQYFTDGKPLIVNYDGIWVPYYAESVRPKGSTSFLIKLEGVENEEEAGNFVNKEIYILKSDAQELLDEVIPDEDEIIGYEIIDADSETAIGVIKDIDDSTVNMIFIVEKPDGEEVYIPANEDFIEEIDDEQKTIKMTLPQGLLDINKVK